MNNPEVNTINPLEGFISRLDSYQESEYRRKEIYDMGMFDQYMFDQQIQNLDQLSDQDAFVFIKNNIEYIASLILNAKWKYPEVLITDKFLNAYSRAISSIPVTHSVRVCTNKICYDYNRHDPIDEIRNIIFELSKTVNHAYIQSLVGCGIPSNIASILALCRFSSIKENVNIKRLNFQICQYDTDIMTVQTIVWIYEKLFDRVGQLFKSTMFEYYTPEQELDLSSESADFSEIYSTISLAILTIINNMSMANIDAIIRDYIETWQEIGRPPVRFSLISLSADYSRIQTIAENLTKEGIYVP